MIQNQSIDLMATLSFNDLKEFITSENTDKIQIIFHKSEKITINER